MSTASQVGGALAAIGKVAETFAPIATAANPIAGALVLLGAELLQGVGEAVIAGNAPDPQLLADVARALEEAHARRSADHSEIDTRDAESRRLIREARAALKVSIESERAEARGDATVKP